MSSIDGRPFLELLLRQLRRYGFQHVILAVGYQREVIYSYFGETAFGLKLTYSAESSPLGTGGALRNAVGAVKSDSVLIMNGDSYTDADLSKFVAEHNEAKADASVVVVPADGRGDCGSVSVRGSGELDSFDEKAGFSGARYINAGIYLIARRMLREITPAIQVSLEKELLPRWLENGAHIRAFVHPGVCIDIGTPERYQSAQELLANVEAGKSQV
jgi:NDP-sugar pyrophosphorylase family protein